MTEVLKINPIDLRSSLLDMGYSLIERGYVKKTDKYKPRQDQIPS